MTVKPITLLHISDLHYKVSRAYDQGVVLKALLTDIERQSTLIGQPDLIVFSGDLVHSADDERVYEKLYDNFIEQLLQTTNCDLTHLYLCPGNHDIHRTWVVENEQLQTEMESACGTQEGINELYLSGKAAEVASQKFNEYFEFEKFFEPMGQKYRDEIISVHFISDFNISIINVNTAWLGRGGLNGISDLQKLAVPEAAIAMALNHIDESAYVVMNFHHPLNWHIEHASQDFQDLLARRVNLYLCGHIHDGGVSKACWIRLCS